MLGPNNTFLAVVRMPAKIVRMVLRDSRGFFMLLRMAVWVVTLSLMIKVLPLTTTFRIITPRIKSKGPDDPQAIQDNLARLIDRLLALDLFVFTPTCWKRAAILHRYLALNGIPNRVIFGVRNAQEKLLEGHAWLEANNQPILEKIAPQYTKIYAFE
jgi:hypothetical protein